MASQQRTLLLAFSVLFQFVFTSIVNSAFGADGSCKFPAIFNLGDSNSDTGGLSASFGPARWPNGETYFGVPSGRYSDGRLVIDFMAESLGLPYLSAYLDSVGSNFTRGANFATAGSTIRQPNVTWFKSGYSPFSLDVQSWQFNQFKSRSSRVYDQGGVFKELLPPKEVFSRALYTFDIGQNDLTAGLFYNKTVGDVKASIPDILNSFTNVVKDLYSQGGGRFFWIHNTGPLGCLPYALDRLPLLVAQVDPVGCATSINDLARHFNEQLKETVVQLQRTLPKATFTYVDIYSARYSLFTQAKMHGEFGFERPFMSCCGHGGKYNYNQHEYCGTTADRNGTQVLVGASCNNPKRSIIWDGIHYTEAANSLVFSKIVNGAYSYPPRSLNMACR